MRPSRDMIVADILDHESKWQIYPSIPGSCQEECGVSNGTALWRFHANDVEIDGATPLVIFYGVSFRGVQGYC